MKILQVANFFKPIWEAGGVARSTYELSRHLGERGHDLTIYTTNWAYRDLNLETNRQVSMESMNVYYFENLRRYASVSIDFLPPIPYYSPIIARKELKNFDIVHINEYRALLTIVSHRYAVKYDIPYILQARGSLPRIMEKKRLKGVFDRIWGHAILNDAARVVALNPREVDQYRMMGVNDDRIEMIPNGVDLNLFTDLPDRGTFRRKFGIGDDEEIVLFLGRIHRIKGIDLLVRAFAAVVQDCPTVRLVIVGPDGGLLPSVKQQINDLGFSDRVLFTGPLYEREKAEAYADADLYVLPSMYETFPNTVLEANACGTPAIITNRCGIAEMFHERGGYVIDYDCEQLKDAILDLLENKAKRERLGEEGRKIVFRDFGWDSIVQRFEKLYEEVLSEG